MRSVFIFAIALTVFLNIFESTESALAIYSFPRQRPFKPFISPAPKLNSDLKAASLEFHREINNVFARLWRRYFDYIKEDNDEEVKKIHEWLYDKGIIKENEPRRKSLRLY